MLLPGAAGINLHRALDELNPLQLSRMTNVVRNEEGALTGRPGITSIFTTTLLAPHHSIGRLNDRITGNYLRIVGVGTTLWSGTTGAFTQIDSGYSGSPLSMVTYHPPISEDAWMYIGDSARMRKVRASDSLDTPIGLPPPTLSEADARFWIDEFLVVAHATGMNARDEAQMALIGFDINGYGPGTPGELTTYDALYSTLIDPFEVANWNNRIGTGAGAGTNVLDTGIFEVGFASVKFTTKKAASGDYYNFWTKQISVNLDQITSASGVNKTATDDDIIHFFIRFDKTLLAPKMVGTTPTIPLKEWRIYFVCSNPFDTSTVPGQSDTVNTDAYVKSFRPSDFELYVNIGGSTTPQAATAIASAIANPNLATLQTLPPAKDQRSVVQTTLQQVDQSRNASNALLSGPGAWTEWGSIGIPLHRRDFIRMGSNPNFSWSTVSGVVVVCSVIGGVDAGHFWLDDLYLRGGAGQDTSLIGLTAYDYRYTNYDPRTGAESNPSPVQGANFQLNSLRQGILVHPNAYGDSAIRQRFYRRGGALNNGWYYLGANTADGAVYLDEASDLSISASALLQLDHDQPVTTVNAAGNTVLAQPVPSIWGPVSDIIFGCGDPYRAGTLYWCKPQQADHWPNAYNVEVCSASEQLMNGCVFAGQSWVFSRERMFACIPNLTDASIVTAVPTSCTHGLVARQGLAVGATAIYFVAKDGVYSTAGGSEQNISDAMLRPIFYGQTKNGYLPIDFTQEDSICLEIFENEVWFQYKDTGGTNRIVIYSMLYNFWRFTDFATEPATVYSEVGAGVDSLLIGSVRGRQSDELGRSYQYTGTSDDGSGITATIRTGSLDQGLPRENKLYGDVAIDADRAATTITGTAYFNTENSSVPLQSITTGSGRQRYYLTGLADEQARNIALEFSWTTTTAPPTIFKFGPSYTPQADTSTQRYTNWDSQGGLSDKYVKGILIEFDTGGVDKILDLQADGASAQTITVNANGRLIKQYSFNQFRGRLLRIAPQDETTWQVYQYRWIFDDEPLALTHWETQFVDNGIPVQQTPLWSNVSLNSTADVTLTLVAMRQDGTSNTKTYTIPSTSGAKVSRFVPFQPQKGYQFKYSFDSSQPFWLYREESTVMVQPWGAAQYAPTHPFGTDDLDKVRQTQEAGLAGVVDRWSQAAAQIGTQASSLDSEPQR